MLIMTWLFDPMQPNRSKTKKAMASRTYIQDAIAF